MDLIVFLSILVTILLFAGLSGGIALGLDLFAPQWSSRKRISWAAGGAALLPMLVPFAGFFLDAADYTADGLEDTVLGFLALTCLTAILMAALCLPVAWYVTTRLDKGEELAHLGHDGDEPILIGPED